MGTQDQTIVEEEAKVEVKVPCEVYSRVVGYLRPVQAWNEGKQQEFVERQTFVVPKEEAS